MKKRTMSSKRQAPSFPNNRSPCSIIQFNRVIKDAITVNQKQKVENSCDSTLRQKDLKSDITSLDPRYKFRTDYGIFLSEISYRETEMPINVQEVFIKYNGSHGIGICWGKYTISYRRIE